MPSLRLARMIAVAVAVTSSPAALAEDTATAARCAGIGEDATRLACYDSVFRRGQQVIEPGTSKMPAAEAGTAVADGMGAAMPNDADFGLTDFDRTKRDTATSDKDVAPQTLTAKVASVSQASSVSRWVVTLDNGQVWRQEESISRARLKSGDTVVIRKASLGSFLLIAPNASATRVVRIK
jgi:hypothetical protein